MPARAGEVHSDKVATAKALFDGGLAHMNAGRYALGCPALAESRRLDPRPGTLFTLAMCESKWGHVATAMAHLDEYLALVPRLSPEQRQLQSERVDVATRERSKLAPRIPELTLSFAQGAPEGTVVKRDGRALSPSALGVGLPVDPGEHVISTQAPGRPVWEQRITIAEGEKKHVALQVKALPSAEAPGPSELQASLPREAPQGRRTVVYVAGGVGLAGLALGAVTGALTFGKKGVIADHCGSGIQQSDETACDATGLEATQSASTLGLVSSIGFGVGLVGLGAAAVLLWTEPKQAEPAAGTASRWISAGVLQAGRVGVVVGARGAF